MASPQTNESRVRFVLIERRAGSDIKLETERGALFRAEWEFRRDYGDNRPIDVVDIDGVERAVRPRDVVEVRNCY